MDSTTDYVQLEPYIRYIRFPLYKKLIPGTRIDFEFPFTVLVGPNGCNKSSILQALYGCPGNKSIGVYWFTTEVDRIDEKNRHSIIYGYKQPYTGQVVEVLKTRIRKKKNPDYWEPSRPLVAFGMEPMPDLPQDGKIPEGRTKTRWKTIDKDVVYLDFRKDLGAYDKYFYHGNFQRTKTILTKQDHIRRMSKPLSLAIKRDLTEYEYSVTATLNWLKADGIA